VTEDSLRSPCEPFTAPARKFAEISSGILIGFRACRLVPRTRRILACRNATSAKLQRLATVTTQRHAIKYMIGFVHAGDYRLHCDAWSGAKTMVKVNPLGPSYV